jgi:hypothetical protein
LRQEEVPPTPDVLPGVSAGSRVRITQLKGSWLEQLREPEQAGFQLVGTLVSADKDSLTIQREGRTEAGVVPMAFIDRIEVSRGVSRWRGALLGAGALGVLTPVFALWGEALHEQSGCGTTPPTVLGPNESCPGTRLTTTAATAIGAAVGAVAGALFARHFGGERWKEVPRRQPEIKVGTTGGGVGVSFAFRF